MAVRILIPLAASFVFFLYLSHLNPDEVTFTYAPGQSITVSLVVLLLIAAFAGAFVLGIVYSLTALGDFLGAAAERLRSRREEKIERLLSNANAQVRDGNLSGALRNLDKILAKAPQRLDALLLQGDVLKQMGRFKDALEVHSLALAYHPSEIDAILHVKDDYLSAGQIDSAYKMLEKVRGRRPKDIGIMTQMREISEKKEDLKRALVLQKEIIKNLRNGEQMAEEKRKLAELICRSANFEMGKGNMEEGLKLLKSALKSSPDYVPAAIILSDAALRQSRFGDAEKTLEKIFRITHSIAVLEKLSDVYRASNRQNKLEELFGWAKAVMDGGPDSKYVYFFIIMVQIELSKFSQADETLKEAGVYFSGTTIYNLARGVVDLGVSEEESFSAEAFKKALEVEWSAFLRYICGECGYGSKDYFASCPACGKWNRAEPRFK